MQHFASFSGGLRPDPTGNPSFDKFMDPPPQTQKEAQPQAFVSFRLDPPLLSDSTLDTTLHHRRTQDFTAEGVHVVQYRASAKCEISVQFLTFFCRKFRI